MTGWLGLRYVRGRRLHPVPVITAVALVCALAAADSAAAGSPAALADAAFDRALARLVSMPGGPPGIVAVVQRGSRRVLFKPAIDSMFPLEQAQAAFARVAERGKRGKVALRAAGD